MPDISLAQKSVLATIILALALVQLALISTARGWVVKLPPKIRGRARVAHHVGGYTGLVLLAIISYYCVFVYGSSGTTRSLAHAILGAAAMVLVLSKVAVAHAFKALFRGMPLLGGLLAGSIAGAWATSSLWYFMNF